MTATEFVLSNAALFHATVVGDDEDVAANAMGPCGGDHDDFDSLGPPPSIHPILLRASAMDYTLAQCAPLTFSQIEASMAWCSPFTSVP
ncbi:hypothetical protein H310_05599 [Aphanomyces invadans]|uniref:Uncharacterized protein n=1 Tax=Aphanomyces invadans TaxID=157072 RepID=A0A024UA88_9STRA|nr:hypothetical protein H310_05599 [Aphanomyces invadans]ETW03189.1 hypothetical protein H310_05599 [Aphanomyces invadans]|eukprot:XP_008868573.1 hypothetical protein H310_05599 [Aphanomyces invadans]